VAIEERPEGERATEAAELRRIPVALTRGWGGLARPSRSRLCIERMRSPAAMRSYIHFKDVPSLPSNQLFLVQQNADGSWDLTEEIARLCGNSLPALREAARAAGPGAEAERLLATLLALKLIRDLPKKVRSLLKQIVRKAEKWVRRATAGHTPPEPHASWEDWAARLVVKSG
jgi:hypothetical protein